jgi:hypothetical protein
MFGWIHLAISTAYISNFQEATPAVGRMLEPTPRFSVKRYCAISPSKHDRMFEMAAYGLRLAGCPE